MGLTNGILDTSSTQHGIWRKEIEAALGSAKQLLGKTLAPLPITYAPSNGPNLKDAPGILADLRKMGFKDAETLLSLFTSEVKGYQDDNKFLLENLVKLLSKLPVDSPISNQLTAGFIGNLWGAIAHPPLTSLGTKYKYREADGSNNNIQMPNLGAANTPYARSAKATITQNIALPDPGLIFDSLMARGDTFEPHPNKISSMLFYHATIIIHDIFRTDHDDFNNSMTSSYLDLAPLYGSNQTEQDTVRTFKDGKLKPDCFSEKRILGFPPGVGVYLIMYNRFHNYVVTQLALISENGCFTKPKEGDPEGKWAKYDNALFQTGRLITCGLYINVVLKDYVRTILNLNRTGTKWDLDPRTTEGKTLFNNPAAEGTGNQVSAEFNLIYRWHSAISQKDDKWTQDEYAKLFPGQKPEDVSIGQLLGTLSAMEAKLPSDPLQRPFANLTRQSDGTFNDGDLVPILTSSISDIAGSFGANKVPNIMRSIEILGIIQARSWNLASLNEFREFAGLTRHTTFEDINPDPIVAEKLRNLYDHPDFVELYPGLVAEKAKPPMSPGSGLCVNFTTSYAILSDAVGLVRGDRFYTVDYTPRNLTNWGFNEVQYDQNVDDGAVLYKLILRAFPNHFKSNSVYAHFPFVIPSENLAILKSLGRAEKYSWDEPTRVPEVTIIKSYSTARAILDDETNWKVLYKEPRDILTSQPQKTHGTNASLSDNNSSNTPSPTLLQTALHPKDWNSQIQTFYSETTLHLLKKNSYTLPLKSKSMQPSYQIDIIRDVINLVTTRSIASIFNIPLKTNENPNGIYTEEELYSVLLLCYLDVFDQWDGDLGKSFRVRESTKELARQLGEVIAFGVEGEKGGLIGKVVGFLHHSNNSGGLSEYGKGVIKTLVDSGVRSEEVVWKYLLPTAISSTATQAGIFSRVLNYYLSEGVEYLPTLYTLSHANTVEADKKIGRYILEAIRLSNTTPIIRIYQPPTSSSQTTTTITDGQDNYTIPSSHRVLINTSTISLDPLAYPDPLEINLTRPLDSYITFTASQQEFLGHDISMTAMAAMGKVIFGLKGLRRAVGAEGEMKFIIVDGNVGERRWGSGDWSVFGPWPSGGKVVWDEE